MGWILIGMAVYFLRPLLPEGAAAAILAAMALAAGVIWACWTARSRPAAPWL